MTHGQITRDATAHVTATISDGRPGARIETAPAGRVDATLTIEEH